MPDSNIGPEEIKISELPAAGSVSMSDQLEVNQSGTTRRVTVGQLAATGPVGPTGPSGPAGADKDIYFYGADGAGDATDLGALDTMLVDQVAYLPRLNIWAKTSIDVGSLIPGPDTVDPMPYLQKIFTAFDTPGMRGRHFIFGRQRAWKFLTRPSLMTDSVYLRPPQQCVLEWQREWDFTSYPPAGGPQFLGRYGAIGTNIAVVGSLIKGDRTATVGAGLAAGLKYGDRVLLRATTGMTTLLGAFTLADANPYQITASISGTTLTVTVTASATLKVGSEIVEAGVTPKTVITALGTGTGGTGTYTVNNSQTVSSRAMTTSTGHSARGEDMIVKSVAGDVITFQNRFQDNYPDTTTPVLQLYSNEPELHLVNPLVMGPGFDGSQTDRFFTPRLCRNTTIEGGRIGNFHHPILIYASMGGVIRDLQVHGIQEGLPGGGLTLNENCTDILVENCVTYGGSQMFMLSTGGYTYGVTRDITFANCIVNGAVSGFATHNLNERINYTNCVINRIRRDDGIGSSCFDIRARAVTLRDCVVRQGNGPAVNIRTGANDFVCDGLRVEQALTGIALDKAPTEIDAPPGNITVRNSVLERIGGVGSAGALAFNYEINTGGVFPTLGPLHLTNNRITMTDLTIPVVVKGKWTNPVVEGNTITGADGFNPVIVTAIHLAAPVGGTFGDGPINPVVRRNTLSSGYTQASITHQTGVTLLDRQETIGVTATTPIPLTANTTLNRQQSGQLFTNTGATGLVKVTLPTFNLIPQRFEFFLTSAFGIDIVPAAGGKIQIGSGGPGENLQSTFVGAWCRLTAVSSTLWIAELSDPGDWAQGFTPLLLDDDLVFWWDIKLPPTVVGGTQVRWTDVVTGFSVVQDTVADQPTWDATAVNFTGNKHLAAATIPATLPIGAAPSCLWVSVDQTNLPADATVRHFFAYGNNYNTVTRAVGRTVVGGVNRVQAAIGDGTAKVATEGTVDFSGPCWVATIYDGTQFTAKHSSGALSAPVASVATTTDNRIRIGGDAGSAPLFFANCKIKRVLLTKLLSAPNQALLEAWLTARV